MCFTSHIGQIAVLTGQPDCWLTWGQGGSGPQLLKSSFSAVCSLQEQPSACTLLPLQHAQKSADLMSSLKRRTGLACFLRPGEPHLLHLLVLHQTCPAAPAEFTGRTGGCRCRLPFTTGGCSDVSAARPHVPLQQADLTGRPDGCRCYAGSLMRGPRTPPVSSAKLPAATDGVSSRSNMTASWHMSAGAGRIR